MTSAAATPRIADDELAQLLELIRGADSVELKLTVPESDQRSTVEALGMDPIDAQIRQASSSTRPTSRSTRPAWWSAPGVCSARARTPWSSCA